MKNWLTTLKLDGTEKGLLLLLLLVIGVYSILLPGTFFSPATFNSVAFQMPELGLLALAMLVPILSGGLNLAIIATANLTGLFMAWLLVSFIPPDAGILVQLVWLLLALTGATLIAVVIGVMTGVLVSRIGAHPILVTLATMTILKGIGIYLTQGAAISGMPEVVRFIGSGSLLGMPVPMLVFLTVAIMLKVFLERTGIGKCIYMSGSNINATYFSGVDTHKVQIVIYVISSALCVVAGLVMMARFNSARMGYGESYLLLTVLAIILGGTNPFGGFGRVSGLVFSLLLLQVISTGLNLMGISQHFSLAMWGLVLLFVLSMQFLKRRYAERTSARKQKPATPVAPSSAGKEVENSPRLVPPLGNKE